MNRPLEDDPRQELAALCHDLRRHLAELSRQGTYLVPPGEADRLPAELVEQVPAAVDEQPALAAAPLEAEGASPAVPVVAPAARPSLTVADIRQQLGDCTRCKLSPTRTNIVFGVGSPHAQLMFIGEAPGAEEDRRGEPFVGPAGQLLDRMIEAMGWTRDSVYIANILKCRPPGNRNPQPDEVAACYPFLQKQIAAIAPRMIVTLGKPAAQTLLGSTAPISALRGRFHEYRGVKVMPTFHPAFLLREPGRKRDTWNDLKQVIAELDRVGVRSPHPPKA